MTFVRIQIVLAAALVALAATAVNAAARSDAAPPGVTLREYPVPAGIAPARRRARARRRRLVHGAGDRQARLARPAHRQDARRRRSATGSAPHGVIVGPDGAPWITDGGLNAIVRVDPKTRRGQGASRCRPRRRHANLNTAVFDRARHALVHRPERRLRPPRPGDRTVRVWRAPGGYGPYGITTTPAGDVYYASLAGSHIARIDVRTGQATRLEPPTRDQGARRVWSDSSGRIWVSEWNAGQVAVYDPATGRWREWKLPGAAPQAYAVYVDDRDVVWLTDFGGNALVRFDPRDRAVHDRPATDAPARTSASSSAARARSGAPSPASTGSSSRRVAEDAHLLACRASLPGQLALDAFRCHAAGVPTPPPRDRGEPCGSIRRLSRPDLPARGGVRQLRAPG